MRVLFRSCWYAAEEGRLSLPHCVATGRPFWPPAPASPLRTGGSVAWREIEAAGMLLSMAVYRRAFQAALAGQLPYGIALIEVLPEVRLFAHVEENSEERRVGQACVSTCRSRWSQAQHTKNKKEQH